MPRIHRLLGLCCVLQLTLLPFAAAEEPASAPPDATVEAKREVRKKFAELSKKINEQPEIMKLRADFEAAQKAYSAAFEAAAMREDPKLYEEYKALRPGVPRAIPSDNERSVSAYDQLSEEQRKAVAAVRKQAMEAPAVKDARKKRNEAKDENERKAAEKEHRAALKAAMLAIDKDLKQALDVLYPEPVENSEP